MKRYFLFPVLMIFILACGPQKQQEGESQSTTDRLDSEVMAVHDEVMPHMQDIHRYKDQIRIKIDSLSKVGVNEGDEVTTLNNLRQQLESADEAMMNWMRSFDRNYNNKTEEEAVTYLEDQKEKVIQVKEEMETALREAEERLK